MTKSLSIQISIELTLRPSTAINTDHSPWHVLIPGGKHYSRLGHDRESGRPAGFTPLLVLSAILRAPLYTACLRSVYTISYIELVHETNECRDVSKVPLRSSLLYNSFPPTPAHRVTNLAGTLYISISLVKQNNILKPSSGYYCNA